MNHLEELMIQITKNLKQKKNKVARRFVTVEGIYHNYGTMCRLREVVALAKQYKFRIVLDDSVGLGTVGPTGRGTVEALGLKVSLLLHCILQKKKIKRLFNLNWFIIFNLIC